MDTIEPNNLPWGAFPEDAPMALRNELPSVPRRKRKGTALFDIPEDTGLDKASPSKEYPLTGRFPYYKSKARKQQKETLPSATFEAREQFNQWKDAQKILEQALTADNLTNEDKVEVSNALMENVQAIRNFILKEISPLELALTPATQEATHSLREITGIGDLVVSFSMVNPIFRHMVSLKMIEFLGERLNLKSELLTTILQGYITNKFNPPPKAGVEKKKEPING